MSFRLIHTIDFENLRLERAKGCWLWDTTNKKYLDMESGIWCTNLGHNHHLINQAAKEQMEKLVHVGSRFIATVTEDSAEELLSLVPGKFSQLTFLNSGSEAIEFSLKVARLVTGRTRVLSISNSYFGAYGSSAESSGVENTGESLKIPLQWLLHSEDVCGDQQTQELDLFLSSEENNIATFLLEPVLIGGGIYLPCPQCVRHICNHIQTRGGLVIIDEVTTGFGRVGPLFGFELHKIWPDILVLGKALGNGFPVSASLVTEEVGLACRTSGLYHAQSHQLDPFGAAIAKAVTQEYRKLDLAKEVVEKGEELLSFLRSNKPPFIREVRGIGLTIGLEVQSWQGKSTQEILNLMNGYFLAEGVLVGLKFPVNLVRLLPPLVMGKEELEYFKKVFRIVITKVKSELQN